MGEADTMSENDDVVRIMSIHKSKGLEFPIVFVPDMDKKYNLQDTTERVNFHVKFGLGLDMVDTSLRLRKRASRSGRWRRVSGSIQSVRS